MPIVPKFFWVNFMFNLFGANASLKIDVFNMVSFNHLTSFNMSCEGIERLKLWKMDSKKVNPFHLSSAEHIHSKWVSWISPDLIFSHLYWNHSNNCHIVFYKSFYSDKSISFSCSSSLSYFTKKGQSNNVIM